MLRGYLLLRGEISRHREDPRGYEPPAGAIDEEWVEHAAPDIPDPWKLISAFRRGAERILEAAYCFGMDWDDLKQPDGHERGREWFPALADRLHLTSCLERGISRPAFFHCVSRQCPVSVSVSVPSPDTGH
ncbi:MAG: hypothetical protein ACK5HY_09510 [Parahaliea sp.]